MYARMGRTEAGTDGAAELFTLHRLAGSDEILLSLWETVEQAAADPTAEWYLVGADRSGGSRGEEPKVCALMTFDGPVSEPVRAAAERAGNERIGPRMATHEGTVRTVSLWQPERRVLRVILMSTSVEALEDAQRVVMSTELLPGEDPALLPGPDHVDLYRVFATAVVK